MGKSEEGKTYFVVNAAPRVSESRTIVQFDLRHSALPCKFLFVHLFGATICLLLDLLHSVDAEVPTAKMLVEERIQQVLKAAETFRYAKDTAKMPGTARIGHIGETLINTTISAAKERQALSPKTRAKESYAETFKVSLVLTADRVPADLTS